MPTMLEPVARFSDVAFAIDATPKALRNWLQRDQVDLFSEAPEGGGWRKYPLIDVAILALVRQLVTFGINVETASSLANTILLKMQGRDWLEREPGSFLMFWINRMVLITPDQGEAEPGDASSWSLAIRWANDLRKPPGPAFLILSPGRIMRTAFNRAIHGDDHVTEPDFELWTGLPDLQVTDPVPLSFGKEDAPEPASDDAGLPLDGATPNA